MKCSLAVSVGLFALALAGSAHAEGDPQRGQRAFAQCMACHSVEPGQNRVGPSLHGVMGQPSASVGGFSYSPALDGSDFSWDDETMAEFLRNPRARVPGTIMAFAGLRNEDQLADIIAYLHQISGD